MRVSTLNFSEGFASQIQQLEQQQNTLQNEASTGLSVTTPDDNPAVMAQVLNLQADASANSQYQKNVTQIQSQASIAGTAMSSLQSITSQLSDIATSASSGTTSSTQMAGYATQVESLIKQALTLANTQDADGNYLFGGNASTNPPFTATTDANGDITAVTYNGNASVNESEISSNMTATAQVPGENNTGSGPQGLFADSRTGANLFADMISLQQNIASGNSSAISSTNVPALSKDDDNVITQISANGITQSALTAAGSLATSQGTNYTTQVSDDSSADLATTMTQLSQTQTAYEAALESGTIVMNMSLLNFLG